MRTLASIVCNACGAALPVKLNATSVTCAYCEVVSPVEADRVAVQREVPAQIEAALDEGVAAMREALDWELSPGLAMGLGLLFLPAILAFGVTSPFLYMGTKYFPVWEAPVIVLAISAPATVWLASFYKPIPWVSFAYWGLRVERKIEAILAKAKASARGEGLAGKCPRCGGKVAVPWQAAVLSCSYCESTLLANDGMLIEWRDEAEARSEAWKAEAKVAVERLKAERLVSPVVGLATFYVVALGLCLLTLGLGVGGGATLEWAFNNAFPEFEVRQPAAKVHVDP